MRVPNSMEFECPVKTHCGDRALNHVPFELRAVGATKPLVIGDEAASRTNRLAAVLKACRDADMTLGVVEGIPARDAQGAMRRLAAIYRDKDCDALVAVGQGTFIDLAKGLSLALATGQDTLAPFLDGQAIPRTLKPLVVVPSAVSDGFELSGYLRVKDRSLRSVHLMPQLLFLDPRSVGQPEDVALVETALNALTNGVEAFFRDDANPFTAIYARTAVMLAAEALGQLAGRGARDKALALTVAHAAALGGCALGCSPLSITQCLGQALAETGKTSAAQARGILLSYALEKRVVAGSLPIDALLGLLGGSDRLARTPEHQRGPAALVFLRNLINQLFETTDGKIGRTLQDIGLARGDLAALVESACTADTEDSRDAIDAVLVHAWEGRPFDRSA